MKKFTKITSIILAIIIVFSLFTALPFSAAAAENKNYEVGANVDSADVGLESTGNGTIDSFINDYRFTDGTSWAWNKTPQIAYYDSQGCCAYCADYVKYCYGYNNPRTGSVFYSVSEIRAGDVLTVGNQSDGYGHWFICLKRSGNSLYVAEGNYSNRVRIGWNYTISGSGFAEDGRSFTAGYHYLSGNEPVKNAWLNINRSEIVTGESIVFSFGAENGNGLFTIGIDKGGDRIYTTDTWDNSFSYTFNESGDYSAYITAYGNGTLSDSNRVYFKVYPIVPASNAWIKADKTNIVKSQSITFTYGADDSANLYTIGIDKDNNRILTDTISNNTYTYKFDEPGNYSVYVTCYGYGGFDDTEKIYITVSEPVAATNAWIKADKTVVSKGQTVSFSYGADNSAGLYTIGIDKDNNRILTDTISNNTYTYKFDEPGNYSVYVTCYGYGGFDDTEKIYITVSEPVAATNAWIKADKTVVLKGQTVSFSYGADNSAGLYTIGIDKDNNRILTDTISNNTYTYKFDEPGNYSVYVTCYGYAGFDDSEKIWINIVESFTIGDTDLDAKISVGDVTAIQRHLADLETFTEEQLAVADTNGDGNVDIADATHLQMYLAEYGVVLGKQS